MSCSRHAVHGGLPALLCGQPACGCLFTLPPVTECVVPECWRNPCAGAWSNALSLSHGFLPALTDAVPSASSAGLSAPQTSGGPLYESLLSYAVWRVAGGDTQIVFCRGVVNEASEQSVRSVLACRGNASRSYEQRFPVCVLRRPRPSGSVPELTRRLSFKTCYLVDPASSHMLVSKIKPCMFKKLVVGPWAGSAGPPHGVNRPIRPFCRRCVPGLNWPGRASGAVTLKKLECSKQAHALHTLAWDNITGFRSYCVGLRDRSND
ncbi:hypothetical protein FCM35_KLT06461 [Carex littledalei]|uniref:Uncharacterized protein n=1 Tax=Carex littledalei TaxID=544730 RepID=A0A833VIG0_9POAL|nr:hypothetical protein FCM35_KLT06461 [Carex littledalei]